MTVANEPWLLWGSESNVQLKRPTTDPIVSTQTTQLAKIRYKRPDAWEFLLWAYIVPPTAVGPGPYLFNVTVTFQITVGVGRSSVTLVVPPFLFNPSNMNFNSGTDPQAQRFVTQFAGYGMRDTPIGGLPDPVNIIDHLVASDIQCNCIVNVGGQPDVGSVIAVSVGSMFAPRTHIRPDWFEPRPSFSNELKGH